MNDNQTYFHRTVQMLKLQFVKFNMFLLSTSLRNLSMSTSELGARVSKGLLSLGEMCKSDLLEWRQNQYYECMMFRAVLCFGYLYVVCHKARWFFTSQVGGKSFFFVPTG